MARLGPNDPAVARDFESVGFNAFNADELKKAQLSFERAVAIRVASQGASHPRVAEDLNTLGAIAYLQGNMKLAESSYRRALRSYEVVLGPNHPEVANTSNNLARILLERRRYREALPLLERAVAIILKEKGMEHDDFVFPSYNLALVKDALGSSSDAELLLRQSLRAARLHKHRNLAPILTDLADIRCRSGAVDEGLQLLEEAGPIMTRIYGADPWRTAWVESTRGECFGRGKDTILARRLLRSSTPILVERWGANGHFGAIAKARLDRSGVGL